MAKKHLSGRFAKWLILLQEFDINMVMQKSIKAQAIANLIVDLPQDGEQVIHEEFPNIFQEEPHHQWLEDLLEGYQWCDFDEISILDNYIYLLEDEPTIWTLYYDGSK